MFVFVRYKCCFVQQQSLVYTCIIKYSAAVHYVPRSNVWSRLFTDCSFQISPTKCARSFTTRNGSPFICGRYIDSDHNIVRYLLFVLNTVINKPMYCKFTDFYYRYFYFIHTHTRTHIHTHTHINNAHIHIMGHNSFNLILKLQLVMIAWWLHFPVRCCCRTQRFAISYARFLICSASHFNVFNKDSIGV